MNMEEILKELKSPFPYEDIDWKVQVTNKDKTQGMAVAYLDSRAIQRGGWRDELDKRVYALAG